MKKTVSKVLDLPSNGSAAALIVLSILFFVGGIAGCIFADKVDGSGSIAATEYLNGYLSVVSSGETLNSQLFAVIWKTARWPLIVVALGLTPLGLIGIPITFLVRAFLLSFSISSFFRILGPQGLVFGFALFGITGMFCIPILFVLGVQSFLYSGALTSSVVSGSKKKVLRHKKMFYSYGICLVLLCLCSLFECYTVPEILKSVSWMVQS